MQDAGGGIGEVAFDRMIFLLCSLAPQAQNYSSYLIERSMEN